MSLKSDLYDVFIAMNDPNNLGGKTGDEYFRDEIDSIVKAFAEGLTLTVTPAVLTGTDTSPTGTFSGSATVSWQFAGGKLAAKLKEATDKGVNMKDSDLSQAFADGLDADPPTWTATLSGSTVTTTTPPATIPSTDSGTVTSTFQSAPVKTALDTAFASMKTMTSASDDPNDTLATALATAITTYYTSSVNQGKGASHLAGVQFAVLVTA